MSVFDKKSITEEAAAVLRENDRGTYTVPTKGLYPFQWNWDSCLTALGLAQIDERRAWQEIETLFEHQWEDGMVPHIVFHQHDDGYFPGPDVWGTNRPVPTSGITQPAVAGFAIKRLFDRAKDEKLAEEKANILLPKITQWHQWFYENRDPEKTGLVAIIHPWESGRDNSIDWDDAFERVPTEGVQSYQRRDLSHANPDHRPTQEQYDRYIWLVQKFRSLDWDNSKLHDASPFQIVDPGFNGILIRGCQETAELAQELGHDEIASRNLQWAKNGLAALDTLWSEKHRQFVCYDRAAVKLVDSASIGGLLAVFAQVSGEQAKTISDRINDLAGRAKFLVPSHDPIDPRFDGKRYWRGPTWLIVNYMIADGLIRAGEKATADRIVTSSLDLILESGFAEYYGPVDGEPCGGGRFTWTAAMVLEFLREL
ncbi:MAG: amylo-alpha-1,6-glucosidase [Rhizobiaceae bacterium]